MGGGGGTKTAMATIASGREREKEMRTKRLLRAGKRERLRERRD